MSAIRRGVIVTSRQSFVKDVASKLNLSDSTIKQEIQIARERRSSTREKRYRDQL